MTAGQITSTYITAKSFPSPNPTNESVNNAVINTDQVYQIVEDFDIEKYFLLTLNLGQCAAAHSDMEDEISYTLYIAENRRNKCPRILINIAGEEIFAVIDTGCEMSIFNENLYNRLRHAGLYSLELPTQRIHR